jgi:hypothetical protein
VDFRKKPPFGVISVLGKAEAKVVVAIARVVVVAIGNPTVPGIVVPAAAAFNAVGAHNAGKRLTSIWRRFRVS